MIEGFGFKLAQSKSSKLETFTLDSEIDGATIVDVGVGGGAAAYYYDLVEVPKDEKDQIKTYRDMSIHAELDLALSEIRNEIYVFDVPDQKAISVDFVENDVLSEQLKERVISEFDNIYSILDFKNKGVDIFNQFYVDGRLFAHKIVDGTKLKDGIKKVVFVDPLEIKKIRKMPQPDSNGIYDVSQIKNSYVFVPQKNYENQRYISLNSSALEITEDAIAYVDSGIYDPNTKKPLGFLHKAIIPYNNLKLMEESLIIYRVVRSPERRVIYVDVGNLPKTKAEAYMKELMNKFRNKLVYDAKSGNIVDRKNVLSMLEDYWLPRRGGANGTEIETLPGANAIGEIADVEFFRDKLYAALNVPSNRFSTEQRPSAPFIFGRSSEIDREEYRFKKFINRLRNRFALLFEDLLRTQLILKNIIVEDDWQVIQNFIQFKYAEDNAFVEYKEAEIMNSRLAVLTQVDGYVGKYYSSLWVQKNVLKMSDEEIETEIKQIIKETPPPAVPPNQAQPVGQDEEQPEETQTQ